MSENALYSIKIFPIVVTLKFYKAEAGTLEKESLSKEYLCARNMNSLKNINVQGI